MIRSPCRTPSLCEVPDRHDGTQTRAQVPADKFVGLSCSHQLHNEKDMRWRGRRCRGCRVSGRWNSRWWLWRWEIVEYLSLSWRPDMRNELCSMSFNRSTSHTPWKSNIIEISDALADRDWVWFRNLLLPFVPAIETFCDGVTISQTPSLSGGTQSREDLKLSTPHLTTSIMRGE